MLMSFWGCTTSSPYGRIEPFSHYYNNDTIRPVNGNIKITFLGVTTLLIDDGETQLLTDGFFSRPPFLATVFSKVSTKHDEVDKVLSRFDASRIKGVFVAHSHYDHAMDIAYVAAKTGASVYGSSSTLNVARGGGIGESKLCEFRDGGVYKVGGFTVTVFRSQHSPARFYNDDIGDTIDDSLRQPARVKAYKEGGSFDFFIEHGHHSIYIKPSANLGAGHLIGLQAEVLFISVGGVGKHGKKFRKAYFEETVGMLKPKLVVPIHWDNFFKPFSEQLTLMPTVVDNTSAMLNLLREETQNDGIDFMMLQGGKSVVLSR